MIETANKVAKLRNTAVTKMLGSGNNGEAFLLEDGTVLKVTTQECEYNLSSFLVNKSFAGINNIYETYKIIGQNFWDNEYVIIQEYLNTEGIKRRVENFRDKMQLVLNIHYYYDLFNSFVKRGRFDEQIYSEIVEKMSNKDFTDEEFKILYDMQVITKSCIEIGMTNTDLVSANLGIKDGKLVMFDLGYSESHSSTGVEMSSQFLTTI